MAQEAVKLRVKLPGEDESSAILATFLQGPPPDESLFEDSSSSVFRPLRIEYTEQAENKKRKHRCIVAENNVTTYEGKNYGEGVVKNGYQYLLGVYSSKRKRLEIYPAEGDVVFGLQLKNVRSESTGADVSSAFTGGLDGMNMRERRDMVIQDFGSKKKQKMERSRKANIVDITAIDAAEDVARALRDNSAVVKSASGVDATAAAATQDKVDAAIMEARKNTLPPFDLHASVPADAYPLEGIMPEDLTFEIQPSVEAFCKAVTEEEADVSEVAKRFGRAEYSHVRERMQSIGHALKAAESGKERAALRRKLQCLFYIRWLLALHNGPMDLRYREIVPKAAAGAGATGEQACAEAAAADESQVAAAPEEAAEPRIAIPSLRFVPDNAVSFMLSQFTEARDNAMGAGLFAKTYVKTPQMLDKLRSYIAVLSLIADDFNLDIGSLSKDMKLVPMKLADLYKEAGCILTSVREGEVAGEEGGKPASRGTLVSYKVRLTAPLTFPKLKLGRRK